MGWQGAHHPRPNDFWGTGQDYEPIGLLKSHQKGGSEHVHTDPGKMAFPHIHGVGEIHLILTSNEIKKPHT